MAEVHTPMGSVGSLLVEAPESSGAFQSMQLPLFLVTWKWWPDSLFFFRIPTIKWKENNLKSSTPTCCSRSATKSARPVSNVWRRKRSKAAIYGHLRPKYRFLKCFILFENLIKAESSSHTQSWWKRKWCVSKLQFFPCLQICKLNSSYPPSLSGIQHIKDTLQGFSFEAWSKQDC